jgi:dTDP-4-amino-4,6-dideoxygalactose transaminase
VSEPSAKKQMTVPMLDLTPQNAPLLDEIRQAMDQVIRKNQFILGPHVQAFEQQVGEYLDARHAIGVSSGTDAILAALMAIGVRPGDEVITTPFTFFSTVSSITRLNARPVFVDIEPDTLNIDPERIEQAVTDKTRAILPVHLFGQPAEMDPILEIARKHGLKVVEDAAQAIGATYKNRRVGTIGDLGCFSFYPTKNLGAFGEGGLITTNDDDLAHKCRLVRAHGMEPRYYHKCIGGNFRLHGLQGAVLSVKLPHLDTWNQGRRRNAAFYDQALADLPVATPAVRPHNGMIYNQYTIRVPHNRRDALRQHLADANIGTDIYYPLPLHAQECFANLGYKSADFPASQAAANEVLSLPIYPELTRDQLQYVADTIKQFYA